MTPDAADAGLAALVAEHARLRERLDMAEQALFHTREAYSTTAAQLVTLREALASLLDDKYVWDPTMGLTRIERARAALAATAPRQFPSPTI